MSYFETEQKEVEPADRHHGYIPSTPFTVFIVMIFFVLLSYLTAVGSDAGTQFVSLMSIFFILSIGIPALIGSLIVQFFVAPRTPNEETAETSERYKKLQWVVRGGVALMILGFLLSKI